MPRVRVVQPVEGGNVLREPAADFADSEASEQRLPGRGVLAVADGVRRQARRVRAPVQRGSRLGEGDQLVREQH